MTVYLRKSEAELILGAIRIMYSRMTQEQQVKADHIIQVLEECLAKQKH